MAFTARTETYVDFDALTDPYDITVTKPEGTVNGDILFCWISWYASTVTIDSEPSGWTLLAEYLNNADRYAIYYKIAASEPANWTWSLTGTAYIRAVCSCYTGGDFDPADPIDVVSNTAYRTYDSNVIAASMTVSAVNSPLVFWAGSIINGLITYTKPSVPTTDWVEDDDAGSTVSYCNIEVCSMIWTGSGATGAMSATMSAQGNAKHAFAVALNPPIGPGIIEGSGIFSGQGIVLTNAQIIILGSGISSGIGTVLSSSKGMIFTQGILTGEGTVTSQTLLEALAQTEIYGEGAFLSSGLFDIFGASGEISGVLIVLSSGEVIPIVPVVMGSGEIYGELIITSDGEVWYCRPLRIPKRVPVSRIPYCRRAKR